MNPVATADEPAEVSRRSTVAGLEGAPGSKRRFWIVEEELSDI